MRVPTAPWRLAFALLASCSSQATVVESPARRDAVVNGTRSPQVVSLTAGEVLAIGFLADSYGDEYCTGTVIAPTVVLTAAHCIEDVTLDDVIFGIGTQPSNPQATYEVIEIRQHATRDAALLFLAEPVHGSVTPIAVNHTTASTSWEGDWTDAVGYGATEASTTGRFFAKVIIENIERDHIQIDGRGEQGLCEGDSGGPLLLQPAGAPVMIIGIEEAGEVGTCVGSDWEVRADLLAPWIDEEIENPTPVVTQPCDAQVFGPPRCAGDDYLACTDDQLLATDCAATNQHCGQRSATTKGCLPLECGAVDFRGVCAGNTVRYCATSGLREEDCTAQGTICALAVEGYRCGCTPCNGPCVDLATAVANCGACGRVCSVGRGTAACEDGACVVAECNEGYADRDGDPTNGCEAELTRKKGCAAADDAELWSVVSLALAVMALRRARRGAVRSR